MLQVGVKTGERLSWCIGGGGMIRTYVGTIEQQRPLEQGRIGIKILYLRFDYLTRDLLEWGGGVRRPHSFRGAIFPKRRATFSEPVTKKPKFDLAKFKRNRFIF